MNRESNHDINRHLRLAHVPSVDESDHRSAGQLVLPIFKPDLRLSHEVYERSSVWYHVDQYCAEHLQESDRQARRGFWQNAEVVSVPACLTRGVPVSGWLAWAALSDEASAWGRCTTTAGTRRFWKICKRIKLFRAWRLHRSAARRARQIIWSRTTATGSFVSKRYI